MTTKKSQAPETVKVGAELMFDNGRLIGWTFFSDDKVGADILEKLMDGKLTGLEYCEEQTIFPHAGGSSIHEFDYYIGFRNR